MKILLDSGTWWLLEGDSHKKEEGHHHRHGIMGCSKAYKVLIFVIIDIAGGGRQPRQDRNEERREEVPFAGSHGPVEEFTLSRGKGALRGV